LYFHGRLQNGNSDLISIGSSELKSVRLNTHADSIEPGGVQCVNLTWLSSPAIKRCGTVQKQLSVHPKAIHSRSMTALRSSRSPVFCGRAIGADAPNLLCVLRLCRGRGDKTSRGRAASLQLAAPALGPCGRPMAGGGSSHSMRRSAGAPNADQDLKGQCVWSGTREGIAFDRLQLDSPGFLPPRPNQFRASAATRRWGSNTVWFFNMK
jgi:hypothetical protein